MSRNILQILLAAIVSLVVSIGAELSLENSIEIENLVDKTLEGIFKNYKGRLRPNFGGQPVNISVTLTTEAISSISEADMDFTSIIHLEENWLDGRLAYENIPGIEYITLKSKEAERIWEPRTFFPNEKVSSLSSASGDRSHIWKIFPSGHVEKSTRCVLTTFCKMDFALFPMDTQICSIKLGSSLYESKDVNYSWGNMEQILGSKILNDNLPYFELVNQFYSAELSAHGTNRTFSILKADTYLSRTLSYYLIQVYLPTIMYVQLSWIPLWIDSAAVVERVSIGVTIILTLSLSISSAMEGFPKAAYTKNIDVFTGDRIGREIMDEHRNFSSPKEVLSSPRGAKKMTGRQKVDKWAKGLLPSGYFLFLGIYFGYFLSVSGKMF
ncbi:unnamed protein product [Allacma fusca]|uniref:Neurotransmitter-gated ion-channel ligand-binding domain-containing protein n=1 Tax=Allacma fusca TaxID=39272 RepID=A0A8J2PQS6_9HEXA|nr:unnamed protein product [Allacma fusca]